MPPALSAVLEAARGLSAGEIPAETLVAAAGPARRFVLDGERVLEQFSVGILRTDRVTELLAAARREVDRQRRALDALEAAGRGGQPMAAGEAATRLREATAALQECLRALEAEERKEKVYSPYPDLDAFLKTGMNVLDLHLPAGELSHRFPAAALRVARLEAAAERFRLLYDHPEEARRAEEALARLQAGLGALATFLQTGHRVPLEDGLRLLGRGSVEVHEALARQDEVAARERRFSDLPALEALFRAADQPVPPEALERLWEGAREAVEECAGPIEDLPFHPLRPFLDLDETAAVQAVARARDELARARSGALTVQGLRSLEEAVQGLRSAGEVVRHLVAERREALEGAPLLADLQVVVGRALEGQVPPAELLAVLDHFRALQDELAEEVQRSAGLMDARDADELQELLLQQRSGCDRLARFADDRDPQHLRAGWSQVEQAARRLVDLGRAFRERLETPSAGPSGVPCIRCGAANPPGSRYCKACSAVLPALAQAPTDYADITGAGEVASTPAHVARLEALVHRVEAGEATPEDLEAEVDDLLERAERVRVGFEQQVVPQASHDATLREYARFFEEQMELYHAGLHTMRLFAETGQPEHLHRGLEACQEAGREVLAMKERIDQALRGG